MIRDFSDGLVRGSHSGNTSRGMQGHYPRFAILSLMTEISAILSILTVGKGLGSLKGIGRLQASIRGNWLQG
jgi:hypothetical protein